MPSGVGCTRGAGLPAHSNAAIDLVTTAPSVDRSRYGANSVPYPAVPDAVMIGLLQLDADPTRTACRRRSEPSVSATGFAHGVVLLEALHRELLGAFADALGGGEGGADGGDAAHAVQAGGLADVRAVAAARPNRAAC